MGNSNGGSFPDGSIENCINEALKKTLLPEVMLFGSKDIDLIFSNEKKFTDLLHEKIKQIKHMNMILLDGILKQ